MPVREGLKNRGITVGLIASIVLASLFIVGFGREYLRNKQIEREIAALKGENERLEGKRLGFLDLISDLSSEYYLEGQSRTKEGLAKPGETLVVIDDSALHDAPEGAVLGVSTEAEGVSNVERWMYYFFDRERFSELSGL